MNSALPVVILSDIHFDPFHDPAKFGQLRTASVSNRAKVLDAPDSPTQAHDFASLQKSCQAYSIDTDWALFASSLKAARAQQSAPFFVTVSGDLMRISLTAASTHWRRERRLPPTRHLRKDSGFCRS
jgi:sphingomyelin phosphodiesterase acid-like 3